MTGSARFFVMAFGGGLLLRLYFILLAGGDTAILMHSDQLDYIRLADILNRQGLGPAFGAERMPVYPLFLSYCSRIAPGGTLVTETFGVNTLLLAVVAQNFIGLAAIYFLYRMGGLIDQTTANLAGGFAALNLNMAIYSSQILTDALFYPVFSGTLYCFFRYRESGRIRFLLLMASSLGIATLVRTVTMYAPLFILVYLLFECNGVGLLERVKRMALFSLFFVLMLFPWLFRNHIFYGHAGMTTQGQGHIIGWVIPAIIQYEEKTNLDKATLESARRWRNRVSLLPEATRTDSFLLDDEAKKWFGEYLRSVSLLSVTKAWFWGAAKNVFSPVSIELAYIFQMNWTHFSAISGKSFPEQAINFVFRNQNKFYAVLLLTGIGLTFLFRAVQLFGAWRLYRERMQFLSMSALFVVYFLAVSGPVGYAKYRLPLEPVFVFLTACAVGALPSLRREGLSLRDPERKQQEVQ